jgi:hypothetical protein
VCQPIQGAGIRPNTLNRFLRSNRLEVLFVT